MEGGEGDEEDKNDDPKSDKHQDIKEEHKESKEEPVANQDTKAVNEPKVEPETADLLNLSSHSNRTDKPKSDTKEQSKNLTKEDAKEDNKEESKEENKVNDEEKKKTEEEQKKKEEEDKKEVSLIFIMTTLFLSPISSYVMRSFLTLARAAVQVLWLVLVPEYRNSKGKLMEEKNVWRT